jgi:hypothetical protein
MPASLERLRKSMKVERTAKKTTLTITIDAYDHKGMVNVDGIPMNNGEDQAEAWLNATMVAAQTINEFYRQVRANRKQITKEPDPRTLQQARLVRRQLGQPRQQGL